MKEVDQSMLDGSNNVAVLNLEKTVRQVDEGLTGDQSGLDRPEAQIATARGFGGSVGELGFGMSIGD